MDVAAFWNSLYGVDHYRYGTAPNAFLASQAASVFAPGARVLVVGDGEGRNGVWLAEQGFDVVTVDASSAGVAKARALAASRGVPSSRLEVLEGLFPSVGLHRKPYDGVVLCYVHAPAAARSALHLAAAEALRFGGVFLLEAFAKAQLGRTSGGPQDADMLVAASELEVDAMLGMLSVELLEETEVTLDEGPGHAGDAAVVRMIARRM
jgi:SAM-dependent methyltransferase